MDSYAFIDESGTDGLAVAKGGNTPLYVLAAVVLDSDKLTQSKAAFQAVRAKYFQRNAEMRSSSIGQNDRKRRVVLVDLCEVQFNLYLLIVDKRNLKSPGFRYPKSFVKNIHDRLYRELVRDFHQVQIRADRVKNPPFMDELRSYWAKHHENSLFSQWDFDFVDSEQEVCVQAADVVAGSVAYCFETKAREGMLHDLLHVLTPRITLCSWFPDFSVPAVVDLTGVGSSDFDALIETRAVAEAYQFINTHSDESDHDLCSQVNCVEILLSQYSIDPDQWVPTHVLARRHEERFGEEISARKLRQSVVGRLRDQGLLIASQRRGGYKIATSFADMVEFVNTQNEKIKKMVDRVSLARDKVFRATGQKLDILSPDEFANLRAAITAMQSGRALPSADSP